MFNCPALTTEQVGESYQASHFCRDHRSQQQDHHTNRKKPPSRTADHIEVRALSWISQDQQARTARFLWLHCSTRTFSSSPLASSIKQKELRMPIADISWHSASGYKSHTIQDSVHCFGTKKEAEAFAIEAAKAWVDARVKAA